MFKVSTLATLSAALALSASASAQIVDTQRVIASGGGVTLSRPIYVTAPPGDTSRLFLVEQRGQPAATSARILSYQVTPSGTYNYLGTFLTISPVATGNEQGLLGLAFHPDYLNNGYFWVHYNNSSGTTIIARYQANPPYATSNTANAASALTIFSVGQPFTNHNGGWIGFGPDGHLYIALGDGGSANDPSNRAQTITDVLGKMLRIDVDGADNIPGNDDDDGVLGSSTALQYTSPSDNPFAGAIPGRDEIWAYGLRNPWRNSFDRGTGRLFIADVGQNTIEEVDVALPTAAGINYGWRCMEGTLCTGLSGCTCNDPNLRLPIQQYTHASGCSITGGYVYRGDRIPAIQGHYFYADYCSATIWSVLYNGDGTTAAPAATNRTADLAPGGGLSIASITSFGEDAAGEMYICDQAGEVFKIVPPPAANNSCVNPTTLANREPTGFNTISATTDGPDEPALCNFNGYTQIGADVWFRYTAPCDGTVRVSLCGANFNTKMAVYPDTCPTSGGQAIACNDDFCGEASEVAFSATTGTVYRIRVGGYQGQVGTGTILATCNPPPPCPADVAGGDGVVDIDDLLAVISAWGPCPVPPDPCPADITPKGGDGVVDIDDLLTVISAWGPCPL